MIRAPGEFAILLLFLGALFGLMVLGHAVMGG